MLPMQGNSCQELCFDAGADWMTCICSATIPTMKAAAKKLVRSKLSCTGIGPLNKAQQWLDAGISPGNISPESGCFIGRRNLGAKRLG